MSLENMNNGLLRGQLNIIYGGVMPYYRSKMLHPLFMIKHKIDTVDKYEIRSFKDKNAPWVIAYEGVEREELTKDFNENFRNLYLT